MVRTSSTYHLYKIALLVKTDDAVKDSVILRCDEPSKALYFIVSGTVEVIQVNQVLTSVCPTISYRRASPRQKLVVANLSTLLSPPARPYVYASSSLGLLVVSVPAIEGPGLEKSCTPCVPCRE